MAISFKQNQPMDGRNTEFPLLPAIGNNLRSTEGAPGLKALRHFPPAKHKNLDKSDRAVLISGYAGT